MLLSRPEEAERSFHQALARDRHRLAQAETDAARAQIQVLLGKTLFYTGDREAVEEHYAQAYALSGRKGTDWNIDRWIRRQLRWGKLLARTTTP